MRCSLVQRMPKPLNRTEIMIQEARNETLKQELYFFCFSKVGNRSLSRTSDSSAFDDLCTKVSKERLSSLQAPSRRQEKVLERIVDSVL